MSIASRSDEIFSASSSWILIENSSSRDMTNSVASKGVSAQVLELGIERHIFFLDTQVLHNDCADLRFDVTHHNPLLLLLMDMEHGRATHAGRL